MAAKHSNRCKKIRSRLHRITDRYIRLDTPWIRRHVIACPRCRKRLASAARVEIALASLKSQPHAIALLSRANAQTVSVLKHSLRRAPGADALRKAIPEPKLAERLGSCRNTVVNTAACMAILILMKVGVFSSVDNFHDQGEQLVHRYYADRAGQDLADEIFSA